MHLDFPHQEKNRMNTFLLFWGAVLALIGIFIASKARRDQRLLKFFGVILFLVGVYFILVSVNIVSQF